MKKTEVQMRSLHDNGYAPYAPSVNVKVYDYWRNVKLPLDLGSVSSDGGKTFKKIETDPGFTHDWVEAHVSETEFDQWWQDACQQGWEQLQSEAEDIFGSGVKVWSAGRSGGWAVVEGLPDVESWDGPMLSKWRKFAKVARLITDDVNRSTLDSIYANVYEPQLMAQRQESKDRMEMMAEEAEVK